MRADAFQEESFVFLQGERSFIPHHNFKQILSPNPNCNQKPFPKLNQNLIQIKWVIANLS